MGSFAVLGALKHFEKEMNKNLLELSCASAGSLIGLWVVLGYTIDQIRDIFINTPIKELTKPNLKGVYSSYGLISHKPIKEYLKKFCKEDETFKSLYEKTKIKFHVGAYCVNTDQCVYFSVDTYPNLPVLDAVCASLSVPLLFQSITINGSVYVDGGCFESVPAGPFLNKDQTKVLVIKINCENRINPEINNLKDFLCSFVNNIIFKTTIHDKFSNMVDIDLSDVNIFNFNMSEQDMLKLYTRGNQKALTHSGLAI